MIPSGKKIHIGSELARKLFPLALSIALVISLIAPVAYSYLEFQRLEKEAGMYSRQLADSIRQLASASPSLWKYQATKYAQIIEAFVPFKSILSIAVLDEHSNPINQFSHTSARYSPFKPLGIGGEPAEIMFNNNKIGEIRIRLAAEAFLFRALIVFLVCLVTGTTLSVLVYRLPLRRVKQLERQLLNYQNSLEELVAQRTMELQETTDRALRLAEDRRQDQKALLEAKATLEQRVQDRTRELQMQVGAKEQALAELAEAQDSLVEVSRAAGMAEVATGVLHNVGNVLNSVNVSCTLLMDQLRESRVGNVAKLAGLMAEPEGGLVRFLSEDLRGRQIPVYLASLAAALHQEQQVMFKEADSLHGRIEHIKEIVTMQQSYGRVSGIKETIAPEQLMEDALKLNAGALARHAVAVQREYAPVPLITVDKHSVLQILLNLIHNAKYACAADGDREKTITLRLFSHGSDRVWMQVADNGVGIPVENITRIFQHGFTTRKSGHGFGLHSGALAARELGGSLTVHSDGPGLGATFTLELPAGEGKKNEIQ